MLQFEMLEAINHIQIAFIGSILEKIKNDNLSIDDVTRLRVFQDESASQYEYKTCIYGFLESKITGKTYATNLEWPLKTIQGPQGFIKALCEQIEQTWVGLKFPEWSHYKITEEEYKESLRYVLEDLVAYAPSKITMFGYQDWKSEFPEDKPKYPTRRMPVKEVENVAT